MPPDPRRVVQRGLGGQPQRDRPEQRVPAGSTFGLAERRFRGGGIAGGSQGNGVGVAKPGGREARADSGPRQLGFHLRYGRITLDGQDEQRRMPGVSRADRGAQLAAAGERSQRLAALLEQQGHHAARAAGGVGGDVGVAGGQLDRPAQPSLHFGTASRQPMRDSLDCRRRRHGLGRAQRRASCRACPAAASASGMTSVMTYSPARLINDRAPSAPKAR